MKKYYYLLTFLCLTLLSCSSDHIPPVTGDIEGSVMLYMRENVTAGDESGVIVTLEGISPERQVLTDKEGNWAFKDVPAGTYNISLSKQGFAPYKIYSAQHVGGSIPTEPVMDVVPMYASTTNKVESFQIVKLTADKIEITLTPYNTNMRYFLGYKGITSPSNYMMTGLMYAYTPVPGDDLTPYFSVEYLKGIGFKSGDELSMKLYGFSFPLDYRFFNPETNRMIYPNISEEYKEVTFKLP